jgi:polysaccharide pyruvyl transferase WcaK-like protein
LKKILIINEGSSSNIGDQAILEGLKSFLKSRNHSILFQDLSCNIRSTTRKSLNHIVEKKVNPINRIDFFLKLNSFVKRNLLHIKNFSKWFKIFKESDYVIVGGGSLLINNNYSFPVSLFWVYILSKFTNKKYSTLGCSGKNVKGFAGLLLKVFLKNAEEVYVRDHNSQKNISEILNLDIGILHDHAINMSMESKYLIRSEKIKLSINVMYSLDKKKFKKYEENLYEILSKLKINNKIDLSIIITGVEKDRLAAKKIIDNLGFDIPIIFPGNLESLLKELSTKDMVLCTRLHCTILSLVAHTPFIGLSWDDKVSGFYKTINLEKYYFNAFDLDIDKLLLAINKYGYSKKDIKKIHENTLTQYHEVFNEILKRIDI